MDWLTTKGASFANGERGLGRLLLLSASGEDLFGRVEAQGLN